MLHCLHWLVLDLMGHSITDDVYLFQQYYYSLVTSGSQFATCFGLSEGAGERWGRGGDRGGLLTTS